MVGATAPLPPSSLPVIFQMFEPEMTRDSLRRQTSQYLESCYEALLAKNKKGKRKEEAEEDMFSMTRRFESRLMWLLRCEGFTLGTWRRYYATLASHSWRHKRTGRMISIPERTIATMLAKAEADHHDLPRGESIQSRATNKWYHCAEDRESSQACINKIIEFCHVIPVPW